MRGNFGHRRQSLKKRLESLRRQNRALAARDRSNRCPTCLSALPAQTFTVFGDHRRYCSALCLPAVTA